MGSSFKTTEKGDVQGPGGKGKSGLQGDAWRVVTSSCHACIWVLGDLLCSELWLVAVAAVKQVSWCSAGSIVS